jgi:hypothetical protein
MGPEDAVCTTGPGPFCQLQDGVYRITFTAFFTSGSPSSSSVT